MLRKAAWVIPALILAAIAGLAYTYFEKSKDLARNAPAPPPVLPAEVISQGGKWEWVNNEDKPRTFIRATSFKEIRNPPSVELRGLELIVYDEDQKHYDLITSDGARFSKVDQSLFAEGVVKIVLGLPKEGPRPDRLLEIETAGVRFEMQTNKAMSDREVKFRFGAGSGQAVGAEYDPGTKEIRLKQQVSLRWADEKSPERSMLVEAGEAVYRETESKVLLGPWSKLRRGALRLEGGNATVTLDQGVVRKVETENARGEDTQPNRKLEFGANGLAMDFSAKGAMEKIAGREASRLVTISPAARTTVTSQHVDLTFAVAEADSTLERAVATGQARVEAQPVPGMKTPPDTKVLTSDTIELKMRPGGEEVERIETHAPAHLELLPNRAGSRKRSLDGERIYLTYGAKNEIEELRAVKVATRTEPDPALKAAPPALTWSQDLLAKFTPGTGEMERLEQWTNFRYQAGARQATADRASLDQAANRITLTGGPRMWDPSGSTDAERILVDQKSGDFSAFGNVRSVRQGERSGSAVVGEETVRATADEMVSASNNTKVSYRGRAVLWQGANRLTAQRIEINRGEQTLAAFGQVVSQLLDKQAAGPPGKAKPAVFTVVKAPEMHYSDKEKMAHYLGGSTLTRPSLQVKSQEIRAYFLEESTEVQNEVPGSGLDKTFATGRVEIIDRRGDQMRQGFGEQAEYLVTENKLTLEGGQPRMVDSLRGIQQRSAAGKQLIWVAQDERLLVDGEESRQAVSTLRKKK
jgi:lipopolysaccharide export system protein LptA